MEKSKRHDWGLILAGALLLLCGGVFFFSPLESLVVLTSFAGAFFVVAGIFNIITYARFHKTGLASGWTIFYAILDIVLGLMFLVHPIVLAGVIPWVVGIFVLLFGAYECVAAFRAKKVGIPMWGWILFSGILEIIIAFCFFFVPASFIIYIAIFLILRGFTLIMFGWNAENANWE
ncbi:MAG: HdeD family acid-resistance protein [Raoultibacter sp.]|jgi:uncharacterized membrane protein HdeD (DUF308 family)